MKLVAFRIQHFKSIVDSEWKQLSADGITALIGQNEAGKSAVLEALHAFDKKELEQDYIRDEAYPQVSCRYSLDGDDFEFIQKEYSNAEAIVRLLEKSKQLTLTRTWAGIDSGSSKLHIESPELSELVQAAPTIVKEEVVAGAVIPPVVPTESKKPVEITEELLTESLYSLTPNIEIFVDYDSLLPAKIDLAEIIDEKSIHAGRKGALNYLKLAGLTAAELALPQDRMIEKKIRSANAKLTRDFQKFWGQFIGTKNKIEIEFALKNHDDSEPTVAGKPFICFWIKDGGELLHPAQRSKGVQWFLSFYLQLQATKSGNRPDDILLIDEPAAPLHAKAQKDVLNVLEDTKAYLQIIYTTHSPYLIDINTLYRIIAVQRDDTDDEDCETKLYDIKELGAASRDTLSPVYTTIGVSLDHQQIVKAKDNVILEEPSAFYYLKAFHKLIGEKHPMYFMPATGVTNIPLLINLFLSWGLEFIVVTDDDPSGKRVRREIKKDIFGGDNSLAEGKLIGINGCDGIEDIFSVSDFKKHVLEDPSVIVDGANSKYLLAQDKPKLVLAVGFYRKVMSDKITLKDFTQQSQNTIKALMAQIVSGLEKIK